MRRRSLISAFFVVFSINAVAQNVPDAGSLMRQTEQNIRFTQNQRNVPTHEALPPEAVFSDTTSLKVKGFKFDGNRLLSEAQLRAATKSFAERALNANDLQHLTDAVIEAYRNAGWLVKAYIPRQDLAGAELIVQVIETIPPSKPAR